MYKTLGLDNSTRIRTAKAIDLNGIGINDDVINVALWRLYVIKKTASLGNHQNLRQFHVGNLSTNR